MPPTEETPTSYTDLAVAVGMLQQGNNAILSGITELKDIVGGHGASINSQATDIALLKQQVVGIIAAQPRKTPWYQTGGFILAIFGVLAAIGGVVVGLVQVAEAVQHVH